MLGEAAAAGRKVNLADAAERGRDGITGARADGAIGFASLRGGDVIGEHEVIFAGPGERVVLGHVATDRDASSPAAPSVPRSGARARPRASTRCSTSSACATPTPRFPSAERAGFDRGLLIASRADGCNLRHGRREAQAEATRSGP